MDCKGLEYTRHALEKMFTRRISPDAVELVVKTGETVEDYPDDTPFPSCLLFGFVQGDPIHVVLAKNPLTGSCSVVTTYIPNSAKWERDFKTRRAQ